MARVKSRSLRGSVMQNTASRGKPAPRGFFYKLRLGLLVLSACLVAATLLLLGHFGWYGRQIKHLQLATLHLTQDAHFAIKDILVEGREHTGKDELFAALGVQQGAPSLAFDPAAALTRVQQLPWVAGAVIERRLPDTIYVRLTERTPLARWQHDNKTVVIDREGKELINARLEDFDSLPLVAGDDAPAQTEALLTTLKGYPAVVQAMKAAVRVGERRWNLHLQPNTVARLPEDDIIPALKRLNSLICEKKILERNVNSIDLRFPDRFILEPAQAATPPPAECKPEEHRP